MSPTRRRSRAVLIAAVVVAAAAAAAFLLAPRLSGDTASDGASTDTGTGGAPSSPSEPYTIAPEPSEVATDAPVTDPVSEGGDVQVVLTYAEFDASLGTVQANGFVAGVIEDGGTCTLTLSKGDDTVTARSTASADATTTSCGLLETGTGLEAGEWEAVLSYTSDRADGTSEPTTVTAR